MMSQCDWLTAGNDDPSEQQLVGRGVNEESIGEQQLSGSVHKHGSLGQHWNVLHDAQHALPPQGQTVHREEVAERGYFQNCS